MFTISEETTNVEVKEKHDLFCETSVTLCDGDLYFLVCCTYNTTPRMYRIELLDSILKKGISLLESTLIISNQKMKSGISYCTLHIKFNINVEVSICIN